MTNQSFISRINWRLILLHLTACWFFIHAFQTFSFLTNVNLIDIIRNSNQKEKIEILSSKGVTTSDLVTYQMWIGISGILGLLMAFLISLAICLRKKWFWFNSFIVFISACVLSWFDFLGWMDFKYIFWLVGQMFENSTVEFSFNGIILLTIGVLIFFLKKANKFIENNKSVVE